MSKAGQRVLSMLLWTWGGTVYFLMEVVYKTLTGKPEAISWTMLVVAVLICIPVERCGDGFPWETPLILQAVACGALATVTEFFAGCIINLWLGMGVWDYSNMPLNILGQICLPFSVLWVILCLGFIPVFDWLRYAVEGGERPTYRL